MKRLVGRGALSMVLAAWYGLATAAGVVREESFKVSEPPPLPSVGSVLDLPSFGGEMTRIDVVSRSASPSGAVTYRGRTAGSSLNNATVTMTSRGFVATVMDRRTGNAVTYRYDGGTWLVRETSRPRHGKCGSCAASRPRLSLKDGKAAKETKRSLTGNPLVDGADFIARGETATNEIDVLVAVDASAAEWMRTKSAFAGEENAVTLFVNDAIERCNDMYANTGLDEFFTFRCVGSIEIDLDCSTIRTGGGMVDAPKILEYLTGISSPSSNAAGVQFWNVRECRDMTKADIVSFLVSCGNDEPEGVLGVGYSLNDDTIGNVAYCDYSYNVCLVEAVAAGNTMAHEIGHNMGAGHADMKDKDSSGPQLYGYSSGYYFDVTNAEGNVFMHAGTVMAYDSDGYDDDYGWGDRWGLAPDYADNEYRWNVGMYTETFFFSSPRHTFKYVNELGEEVDSGIPVGDETHDNTRLLSLVYPVVANYRVRDEAPLYLIEAGSEFTVDAGVAMAPIKLTTMPSAGVELTVGTLPAGLKYNKTARTISGTPTKVGIYTVTATLKTSKRTVRQSFSIRVVDRVVSVKVSGSGSVKGAGRYTAGKKVSLKATPAKKNVLDGWYDEGGKCLSKAATYAFTMTTQDVSLVAKFATAEADAKSLKLSLASSYEAQPDGSFLLDLGDHVSSISVPKITVKGLPTGLKFDSKTSAISGVSKKPGVYTVSVSAKNSSAKNAVAASFALVVPNLQCAALPKLEPATDAYGTSYAGVSFDTGLVDCTPAKGWAVKLSGLPSGLKWDSKKGVITGIPSKAGTFTVTFTATKKGAAKQTATITLAVAALPEWAYGTFNGYMADENGGAVGLVEPLTVSSAGKISGKILKGGKTWTLSANSYDAYDDDDGTFSVNVLCKSGKDSFKKKLFVEIGDAGDGSVGFVRSSDDSLYAYRNMWGIAPWKSIAGKMKNKTLTLFVLDDGTVYAAGSCMPGGTGGALSLKFGASGKVTSKFNGYSCSSTLVSPYERDDDGRLPCGVSVYFAPNEKKKFGGFCVTIDLTWTGSAFLLRE